MESIAEERVVEAARRGDVESFAALYRRYYAMMVWLAYSILLNRDQAQDAAQQTFVKACENLADLKRTDRFGPWLAAICRNEAHQLIRARRQPVGPHTGEDLYAEQIDHDSDDHRLVRTAIDQLEPVYREIVVLHYYNDMEYRQIAAALGIAEHTVRGRLFRARRQIEKTLRKKGFPEGS
ncbi:MAG: sigma-70 family RNA polymerase sigma factor [Phycisphaerae bacterium]|nr:sigma-70 family RNA polymerase sigma factor [Phycisphaerae bacterium]